MADEEIGKVSSPDAAEAKDAAEGVDGVPASAFNDQMILLDAYLGNLIANQIQIDKTDFLKDFAKNVPTMAESYSTINNLTYNNQAKLAKIQDYIDNITAADMAQILPDIQLKIIDSENYDSVYVVPFTDPGNISAGYTGVGYHTTRTIGLKSIQLSLDGKDNPFFGAAYIVDMELMFDSINTFFDTIPGGPDGALTYAQAFRSSGRVAGGDYFTRLEIGLSSKNNASVTYKLEPSIPDSSGMSGDPGMSYETQYSEHTEKTTIEDKYGLRTDGLSLVLNLQLVKTDVTVDENLQTTVKVSYISQEESLFKSQEIFNVLGLNLEEAEATEKENQKELARKREILNAAAEAHRRAKEDELAAKKFPHEKKIQDLKFRLKELQIAKSRGIKTATLADGEVSDTAVMKKYGAVADASQREYNIDKAILLLETEISLQDKAAGKIDTEIQDLNNLTEEERIELFKADVSTAADEYTDIESKIQTSKRKLANLRTEEIDRAIYEIFDSPEIDKLGVFKYIAINAEEAKNYYAQGSGITFKSVKTKNLGNKPSPASGGTATSYAAFFGQSPGGTPTGISPPPGTTNTEEQMINDAFNEGGVIAGFDALIAAGQNVNDPTVSKVYGNEESMVAALSQFKAIKYILLGDFLRILFKRLYELLAVAEKRNKKLNKKDNSVKYKAIIDKTVFLLSTATFTNFESRIQNKDSIYNIPLSVKQLRLIFAKSTYTKSKNFLTIFEVMEKIVALISNSRKMKAKVLNVVDYSTGFNISKQTYSLTRGPNGFKVASGDDVIKNTYHGIVLRMKRVKENDSETDLKPKFIYGGVDRGIIRSFQISSMQDDSLAKMVDEEINKAGEEIIPVMFQCQIKTFPALFLQLGSVFEVVAPSVRNDVSGFFLEGDYRIYDIKHSYSAGGQFETSFTGIMDSTRSTVNQTAQKAEKPEDIEKLAREGIDKYKELLQAKEIQREEQIKEITKEALEAEPVITAGGVLL